MNWTDLAVIAVITLFIFICWKRGFLLSLVGLGSVFVSFLVTWKFYPVLADYLMKTKLNTSIVNSVSNYLLNSQAVKDAVNTQVQSTVSDALKSVVILPEFVRNKIVMSLQNTTGILPMREIVNYIAGHIAKLVITGLSILIIYAAVKLALMLVTFLVKRVNKLPVIKQTDKVLGLFIGVIQGLLFIYVAMAIVVLLGALPQFKSIEQALDKSLIAHWFYQNNILLGLFG